jgi:hypothetical protein
VKEADLLRAVEAMARKRGVLAYHDNDSRKNTPGLPDLILVGGDRVVWVELKTEDGRLTHEQTVWRYRLIAAGQTFHIWRPKDLLDGTITDVLDDLAA